VYNLSSRSNRLFFNNLLSFSDIPQFLYFFLILGLLSFLIFQGRPEKEIKIKLAPISRLVIFIFILILAAIFIFYYNLEPLAADNNFINSIISINNNNCPDALNDAARAAALGGGNSLFYQGEYIQLGLLCYGSLPAADQQSVKNNLLLYAGSLPAENYFYFANTALMSRRFWRRMAIMIFPPQPRRIFRPWPANILPSAQFMRIGADFALQTGRNDEALKLAAEG